MPTVCEHGRTVDWGDFGEPGEAERCLLCDALSPSVSEVIDQAKVLRPGDRLVLRCPPKIDPQILAAQIDAAGLADQAVIVAADTDYIVVRGQAEATGPVGLGGRLAAARRERGWTQARLAECLGVGVPHVSKVERDKETPSAELAELWGAVLGVDVSAGLLAAGTVPLWLVEAATLEPWISGALAELRKAAAARLNLREGDL